MTCGLPPRLFLLLISLLQDSEETCPSMCLCISDTISCSSSGLSRIPTSIPTFFTTLDLSHNHFSWLGPGNFNRMPQLENVLMSHNQISSLGHGVFRNASSIRHIDLSSNKLRVVEQHYFEGLWRLEELLLYNNRITQVEASTMSGLSSLKKAYFSLNQITHFPFFSIQDHSHPFLSMLDLSSNRMSRLPWEDVKALPGLLQRGLYLHNNSLICDCTMYSVFWHWDLRGYNSIKDFTEEHTCTISGDPKASIQFLKQNRFFFNCSLEKVVSQTVTVLLSSVLVSEGEGIRLDCQTSLNSTNLSFTWLSPSRGSITKSSVNDTQITLFPNGTLEIQAVKSNDSGLYMCTAVDFKQALNATREVNVTVQLPQTESFNTGYTTLLGCVVTLVLILMYLYLTPCQCNCCKPPRPAGIPIVAYDPSSLSSVFLSTSRKPSKPFINKHVAFMEPTDEEGADGTLES
ncbi:amphoterin-induced protein 3 [Gouania willdenowi]|uniref:Ig-like domain-containing protein n=1 Tax=Gouania willdenowi TaxID=441366 RepID=A0A8C5D7Z7_GOUWI|nr:amphoterin-induced protein 3 [Gouania willdenowi]XP_028308074.1 amphoterin-induced protein 3 [Gouania willdenowi]